MRCESDLNKIFYKAYSEIRRKNCIGCQYDHPSQKYHSVCLTDIYKDLYIMKTLTYLLNKNIIDKNEFNFLNEELELIDFLGDEEELIHYLDHYTPSLEDQEYELISDSFYKNMETKV